jgi:acyl-coenzyme A thioesterase PaaI-like protein
MKTSGSKRYGIISADKRKALSGLEFVAGLVTGSLPLNTMARTLGYDIVEGSNGRVVVTSEPDSQYLNPEATVHG